MPGLCVTLRMKPRKCLSGHTLHSICRSFIVSEHVANIEPCLVVGLYLNLNAHVDLAKRGAVTPCTGVTLVHNSPSSGIHHPPTRSPSYLQPRKIIHRVPMTLLNGRRLYCQTPLSHIEIHKLPVVLPRAHHVWVLQIEFGAHQLALGFQFRIGFVRV